MLVAERKGFRCQQEPANASDRQRYATPPLALGERWSGYEGALVDDLKRLEEAPYKIADNIRPMSCDL